MTVRCTVCSDALYAGGAATCHLGAPGGGGGGAMLIKSNNFIEVTNIHVHVEHVYTVHSTCTLMIQLGCS